MAARTAYDLRTASELRTASDLRTAYDLRTGMTLKIFAAATSGAATIMATYWDIVVDWGLLQRDSRNPWLRDKLVIPNRSVYFVAMVTCYIT